MTNLDSGLKSKDITLPTKVHIAKAMVFPVFCNVIFSPHIIPCPEVYVALPEVFMFDNWPLFLGLWN